MHLESVRRESVSCELYMSSLVLSVVPRIINENRTHKENVTVHVIANVRHAYLPFTIRLDGYGLSTTKLLW